MRRGRRGCRRWRDGAGFQAGVGGGLDDAADDGAGGGRHGDDDGAGVELVGEAADVRERACNGELIEAYAILTLVIVDEGDRIHPQLRVRQQLLGDHLSGRTGADDDRTHIIPMPPTPGVPRPHSEEKSRGNDEGAGEETIDRQDRERDAVRGEFEEWNDDLPDGCSTQGGDDEAAHDTLRARRRWRGRIRR